MPQDVCPICTEKFTEKDIVVEFRRREGDRFSEARFAHLDCLLSIRDGSEETSAQTLRNCRPDRTLAKGRKIGFRNGLSDTLKEAMHQLAA